MKVSPEVILSSTKVEAKAPIRHRSKSYIIKDPSNAVAAYLKLVPSMRKVNRDSNWKLIPKAEITSSRIEAVTEEQFKKWPAGKRSAYLKEHPASKFGENKDNKLDKKMGSKKAKEDDSNLKKATKELKKVITPKDLHTNLTKWESTVDELATKLQDKTLSKQDLAAIDKKLDLAHTQKAKAQKELFNHPAADSYIKKLPWANDKGDLAHRFNYHKSQKAKAPKDRTSKV